MLTVTPFLWFDNQAEEAMNLYLSIFPNSRRIAVRGAPGRVSSVEFELEGQKVMAMNAGPHEKFSESFSFFVGCETQAEVDALWEKLTADGGTPGRCGWLKDRFGLSWQVIPNSLGRLLGGGGDSARAKRVLDTMLTMSKLDAARLQQAYDAA